MIRQLRSICGQGEFVEPPADPTSQLLDQIHYVPTNKRLASGQPDALHSASDQHIGQRHDLFEVKQIPPWQKGHTLGHAIAASQVASVGHGHANVSDPPSEGVDHRRAWQIKPIDLSFVRASDHRFWAGSE